MKVVAVGKYYKLQSREREREVCVVFIKNYDDDDHHHALNRPVQDTFKKYLDTDTFLKKYLEQIFFTEPIRTLFCSKKLYFLLHFSTQVW